MPPGGQGKQIERMCRAVEALLEGRVLTAADLSELLGVGVPQARRYVRHLCEVKGVRKTADGIQLSKQTLFDAPTREAAVAAALMAGLGELFHGTRYAQAMRDALEYVATRAPRPLPTDGLLRRFRFATRGGDPAIAEKAQVLETVVRAVLDSERLTIKYVDFDGDHRNCAFEPLTLIVYEHQLYLIGREPKESIEPLRFSRLESAQGTKQHFEYPSAAAYNLDALLHEIWGVFVGYDQHDLEEVVVRLAPRWRTFANSHRWHPSQQVIDADKGLVRFTLRACPEFRGWVLNMGAEIEVVKPAWLREWVSSELKRALAIYQPADSDCASAR
jgi:predicted DNA-binding transcriptional regulator YafY